MRKVFPVLVAAAAFSAGGTARAQGSPGVHEHDGFFLRMDLGFGGMSTSASDSGLTVEMSGGASQFSVALGGAVVPNLVVAGHLWGATVSSPEVKLNGTSLGAATDATLTLSGVGVNVTYYFMPINVYLSATPSVGVLSARWASGQTSDTEGGFAIRLAVGKEWWVSDNWGIGLDLQYAHSSNKMKNVTNPPTWQTNWVGLAFSATYN